VIERDAKDWWSSRLTSEEIEEAENWWLHGASVTAVTFRVETPWIYISVKAETSAFSDRR